MKYLIPLLFLSSISLAESPLSRSQNCQNAIKECYLGSPADRSQCLNNAVRIKECDSEKVASLIEERLALTGVSTEMDDSQGIDTVDHTCIKNFDSALSAELIKGIINPEMNNRLNEQLSGCSQKASINLFRP